MTRATGREELSTIDESPPPDPHLNGGSAPGPPRYASACLGQASRGSPEEDDEGRRGFATPAPYFPGLRPGSRNPLEVGQVWTAEWVRFRLPSPQVPWAK
jgi:hypothetical protein